MLFVPVVDSNQKPLMPTTANRAARWIKSGKCTPFWKRGVFCDAAPHLAHLNGKDLFTHLGVPGYSVSITQSILKYHRETIERLSKRFERGAAVVENRFLDYRCPPFKTLR